MVVFTDNEVGTMVEEICGEGVRTNFEDPECGPDPHFPSDVETSSDEDDSDDADEHHVPRDFDNSAKRGMYLLAKTMK